MDIKKLNRQNRRRRTKRKFVFVSAEFLRTLRTDKNKVDIDEGFGFMVPTEHLAVCGGLHGIHKDMPVGIVLKKLFPKQTDNSDCNVTQESEPANSRQIATESYRTNAPPAGPPSDDTYATLQALLPCIFDDLITTDTTPTQYFRRYLRQPENRQFILEKINQEVQARDEISLDWLTLNDDKAFKAFENFENAVKGETTRLILTILRDNAGTDRQEPIIRAARTSLHREIDSLDAPLPSSIDGKTATLHDITPSGHPDPLAILLARETAATEQAAIAAIPDDEKARIIAEYDAAELRRKGLLFNVQPEPDDDAEPTPPRVKPRRIRRDRTRQQAFAFAGGAR